MACQHLKSWGWLLVSLSLLCQSADALASTRLSKTGFAEQSTIERSMKEQKNQQKVQSSPDYGETLSSSVQFSRRSLFRQAGIASATVLASSAVFTNPLPAQAAVAADSNLDSYLVSSSFSQCTIYARS